MLEETSELGMNVLDGGIDTSKEDESASTTAENIRKTATNKIHE